MILAKALSRRAPSPSSDAAAFELRGRPLLCTRLVETAAKDVLNVGCSFGWYERVALADGASRVVGIDVDDAALAIARADVPGVELRRASALALPFAEDTFDLVTMFDVIEHVPRGTEPAALGEARRVLRPGGTLALSTPNASPVSMVADPAWPFGHRHYRTATIERLLASAGFERQSLRLAGGLWDGADMLLYYAWRHALRRARHPFDGIRRRADVEWRRARGRNTILVVATARKG